MSYRSAPRSALHPTHCAIAFAFGRNSIPDLVLPEVARIRQSRGSDITAIKQLLAARFDPGGPNKDIGETIGYVLDNVAKQIAAQWEAVVALAMLKGVDYIRHTTENKKPLG